MNNYDEQLYLVTDLNCKWTMQFILPKTANELNLIEKKKPFNFRPIFILKYVFYIGDKRLNIVIDYFIYIPS